jgi:L-ascorbate metabolism protein UlaG (beta-lactamase superfamily)
MHIRWLGVGGMELEKDGFHLLVDPFLSRPPMRYLLGGTPRPDTARMDRLLPACRAILISHAHYDHLMDVPYLAARDRAAVYGSENAIRILAAYPIDPAQCHRLDNGVALSLGPFSVHVLEGRHGRIFGLTPYYGTIKENLRPPLAISEFRMDRMFSFLVQTESSRILFWNKPDAEGAMEADVLILLPQVLDARLDRLLDIVNPKHILPIHWENFFRPPEQSAQEFLMPGGWPFRKQSLRLFAQAVRRTHPRISVEILSIFQEITV